MKPPSGEVTFLFTDVQGSSALWEEFPDAMSQALAEHDRRLREAFELHDGYVFTTAGDSFAVAFRLASNALEAALAAQLSLLLPTPGPEIRVRIGLHTGTTYERGGDYFGPVVNRAARLMSAGHGGQILVSGKTAELLDRGLGQEVELIDLGEHQLKDLSRPEHIYQVAHPSLDDHFPSLRTVDPASSNLPIQLTSFIGRGRELAEATDLITDSRLVTLAGPSGSGKTRLALQVAADSVHMWPGGIALAELAPVTDPDLMVDTVAATVHAKATPETPLIRAIADKIGDQELLLVLDNCEHVVGPVATMVRQLLTPSPGLKVLATSQIPLGVPGEAVYRVPSLPLPDVGTGLGDALRFDAITMFVERAMLAKASFELTTQNLDAVIAICRHLDGIPLALELAAARVKMLTPERIADRLGERFRLLTGGPRLAEARHQTLLAAIDWSHDLLADDEQTVFRRCSVFSGSFDLSAVETVCSGESVGEHDVLDLMSQLIDKSLVTVEDTAAQTRYRLLESMRQYGLDRLEARDESAVTSLRHADYFASYAEELQRAQRRGDLGEALDGMRHDRSNLRSALDFALNSGHLEQAGRIIGGIGYLWYTDGAFREGVDWCARFFAFDPDLDPSLMASVLHSYGTLLGSWSQPEAGAEILEREVALRRQLGDPARLAAALNNLGASYNDAGRRELGDPALLEAIGLMRSGGTSPAMPLSSLAHSHMNDGEYEQAMGYCEQSLFEAQQAEDSYDLALAAASIGQCASHLGLLVPARSHLEDARRRYLELGVRPGVQDVDLQLAMVDRAEGRVVEAAVRLARFLDDPEAHWFLAGKYWAVQVTASILDDDAVAAELIGATEAYYDGADEASSALVRPAWVRDDLEVVRRRLVEGLGAQEFDRHAASGAGLGTRAIEAAREALRAIAAPES